MEVPSRDRNVLVAAGCVALSLALAVAYGSVWEHQHDEGITLDVALGRVELERWPAEPTPLADLTARVDRPAGHGVGDVIDALGERGRMPHPPLYYLMVHAWAGWVGTGALALRLPAYLLGALTVLGVGALARRMIPDPRAAGWAMLLVAVSPWFSVLTNFLRPYSLALCLAVWSSVAMLAFHAGSGSTRTAWRVLFAVLSVAGIYTLYHYAFLVVWQGVILTLGVLRTRRAGDLAALAGVTAVVVAAYLPWWSFLALHLEATGAVDYFFSGAVPLAEWPARVKLLVSTFALAEVHVALGADVFRVALLVLELSTAAVLIRLLLRLAQRRDVAVASPAARITWWCLPLLPGLIALADAWHDTHTLFITKYSFVLFPFGVLLFVLAWLAVPRPALARAGLMGCALLFGLGSVAAIATRAMTATGFESIAAEITAADGEHHLILTSTTLRGYLTPLLLTLRDAGVRDVRVAWLPPESLDALAETPPGKDVTRVTMINLAVPYRREEYVWTPARLRELAERARASGWQVQRGPAGGDKRVTGSGTVVLTIFNPVRSKSFHGVM